MTPRDLIYCIGDSHCGFFSGRNRIPREWPKRSIDLLPYFRTFRIGAPLAYNLPVTDSTSQGRERLFEVLRTTVPYGSRVLLCFGEIDCRAHLLKQARERNVPVAEIADACAARYLGVVREIIELGFRPMPYNAIASMPHETDPTANYEFPTVGTCRERNEATSFFNAALRRGCAGLKIGFLENFELLVDADGLTRGEWYGPDHVHLSQRAMPMTLERLRPLAPEIEFQDPPFLALRRRFWDTVKK